MTERITELGRRYSVRQPTTGPRVQLGTLWFVALMVALVIGSGAVALVFAVVGGVAALQTAGAWRARKVAVNQPLAGLGAMLLPLAAWWGNRAVAVALILFAVFAVVAGTDTRPDRSSFDAGKLREHLPVASATLRSGLFIGLASAAAVQVHRVDAMSFLYLVAVVCVYDSGDYLIGSGTRRRLVGPVAGLAGVAVVVVSMTAINPPPLTGDGDVRWLGLVMGLCCPLGQMLGSWLLPSTRAKAPALRRVDSWLLAGPALLIGLWVVGAV